MDLNKFTQKAQQAVLEAQHLAQDYNHQSIEPAHLLLALLNQTESTVPVVISQIAGGVDVLQEEIRKELANRPKVYGSSNSEIGLSIRPIRLPLFILTDCSKAFSIIAPRT